MLTFHWCSARMDIEIIGYLQWQFARLQIGFSGTRWKLIMMDQKYMQVSGAAVITQYNIIVELSHRSLATALKVI